VSRSSEDFTAKKLRRPTMFDDHAWFAPFMETFTKTKLPWAQTGALRSFEEFPPMEAYEGLMKEYAARVLSRSM
jgi:hypothetical protein